LAAAAITTPGPAWPLDFFAASRRALDEPSLLAFLAVLWAAGLAFDFTIDCCFDAQLDLKLQKSREIW
jgi:hypothetical protein